MKYNTPILFLTFNRLDTTKLVFEEIRKVEPAKLYLASDGPRDDRAGEKEKVESVRNYVINSINWDCEVKILFREKNLGCRKAVSDAITWFFQSEEFGIILEDDCLPHLDFFKFCNELGNYYKNDDSVFAISGTCVFSKNDAEADYFFSMMGGIWGWATWKRAWSHYSVDINKMLTKKNWERVKKNLKNPKVYSALKKLIKQSKMLIDEGTWDYQWLFIRCLMNGKSIVPKNNLIKNIGFRSDATHTKHDNPMANLDIFSLNFPLIHPQNCNVNKEYDKYFVSFWGNQDSIFQRIIRKAVNKFKKISFLFNSCYLDTIRYKENNSARKKRYRYYKKYLKHLGKNVTFNTGVFITGMEYVSIGDNTHIDKNCIITGCSPKLDLSFRIVKEKDNDSNLVQKGEVIIGKDCHISQNTMIYGYGGVYIGNNCVLSTGAKIYSLTSMPNNPNNKKEIISIVPYNGISPTLIGKVILEDNTWLGINTVVSPGVTIKKNSFARSNSFILKSFDENSYIAGDPAVFIRKRFD